MARINSSLKHIFLCFVIALVSIQTHAEEPAVVELSATVTGNQEQPKVIYIVPWQQADDDTILYQPLNSETNSIFAHVERSEHQRQLKFIKNMEEKSSQ